MKETTPSILSYNAQNLRQCLFLGLWTPGTKLVRLSYARLYEMLWCHHVAQQSPGNRLKYIFLMHFNTLWSHCIIFTATSSHLYAQKLNHTSLARGWHINYINHLIFLFSSVSISTCQHWTIVGILAFTNILNIHIFFSLNSLYLGNDCGFYTLLWAALLAQYMEYSKTPFTFG